MQKSILVIVSAALMSACSTTSHLTEAQVAQIKMCKSQLPVSKRLQLESVSTGCIVSYPIKRMINDKDPSPLLCLAGGASGFLLGESIAERKCAYLSKEQQLDGEIAHVEKLNQGMTTIFAQQSKDLKAFEGSAASLTQQKRADEQQQAQHRHQTHAHGAAGHPDPGSPRFKPLSHCLIPRPYRELYFSRRR